MSAALQAALAGVPATIRSRLMEAYVDLKRNLAEGRLDAAGLCAGKLCEAVIRLCQERVFAVHRPFGTKIPNLADECRRIITGSAVGAVSDSEKLIIPRAVVFLYTMRNKRGIGHVGGDVDPNVVDSSVIGSIADWVVCELIRVHHGMSLEEAQDLVDALGTRRLPDVWEVGGKKRVLREGLLARDQALLLLYSTKDSAILTEDLISWIEYSNPHVFKSSVLSKLHQERLVEWDKDTETVILSPKGASDVETRLIEAKGQPRSPPAKAAPLRRNLAKRRTQSNAR
jgi:hypothetical protein